MASLWREPAALTPRPWFAILLQMPSCGRGECLVSGVRTISGLGDNPSFLEGVLRYCRRAQTRWSWLIARPVDAALSNFFIDFTVASALPLLCGYWGADVVCRKPHCCAKSLNSLEVNCGPPSDQPECVGYSCTTEGCPKSRGQLCGCCPAFHPLV